MTGAAACAIGPAPLLPARLLEADAAGRVAMEAATDLFPAGVAAIVWGYWFLSLVEFRSITTGASSWQKIGSECISNWEENNRFAIAAKSTLATAHAPLRFRLRSLSFYPKQCAFEIGFFIEPEDGESWADDRRNLASWSFWEVASQVEAPVPCVRLYQGFDCTPYERRSALDMFFDNEQDDFELVLHGREPGVMQLYRNKAPVRTIPLGPQWPQYRPILRLNSRTELFLI
jgi:hypothetical protein